jgi:hypothetical protein
VRPISFIVLTSTLCFAAVSRAADSDGYRLSGVLDLGDRVLAMLELPDQRQITVGEGATVNDFRVVTVDRRTLVLQKGEERIVLTLTGTDAPAPAQGDAFPESRFVARSVDASTFDRLSSLRAQRELSDAALFTELSSALHLPAASRIALEDAGLHGPAVSPRALLEGIHTGLRRGTPVKLYFADSTIDEVYLTSSDSGE